MKSFVPLIKLATLKLDEKKRKLGEMESLRANYEDKIAELESEVQTEQAIASGADDFFIGRSFPQFVAAAKAKRENFQTTIDQIGKQIEVARLEVQAAYQEVRKYEIAEEKRLEREKQERDRRENAAMDELAMTVHRRRRMATAEA